MNFAFLFILAFLFRELIPEKTYDAEVLEQRTECVVRNNRLTTDRSYRIRINNAAGDNFSRISIYYSRNEPAIIEYAWIENKFGQIVRKLEKKEITTRSAISGSSLYEDHFIDEFTLRYNDYPYVICYKYSQTNKEFFQIITWYPAVYQEIPTLLAYLSVQIPKNYEVLIHENKIDKCEKKLTGNDIILSWNSDYKNPRKTESNSPFYADIYPSVRIVPVNFLYSNKGSFKNSIEYGNWEESLLEGARDLSPSDKEQILRLTMNCKSELEKIRTLYHYLQDNTRYINVTVDVGGWKPYPASYVAAKKYGDCKALSNYMCSILKVAGIKSYYTDVYAGDSYPATDTLISNSLFNHVFVFVPMAKDTIWLECTSNSRPLGYLGTFTQNREAFIVEKDKSRFVHTPGLNLNDVLNSRNIEFKINEADPSTGKFNFRLRGYDYEFMNDYKSTPRKGYQEKWLTDLFGFRDFTILNWNFMLADRDSAYIDLHTDLELRGFVESYNKTMIISQIRFPLPEFEPPDKRRSEVVLAYPISSTDTIEYELPSDFTSISVPSDTIIKTVYGSYCREIVIKNKKTVILRKSLKILPSGYSLKEYPDFYGFIKSVKNEETKFITVKYE